MYYGLLQRPQPASGPSYQRVADAEAAAGSAPPEAAMLLPDGPASPAQAAALSSGGAAAAAVHDRRLGGGGYLPGRGPAGGGQHTALALPSGSDSDSWEGGHPTTLEVYPMFRISHR